MFTVFVRETRTKTYLPSKAALSVRSALCKSTFFKTKNFSSETLAAKLTVEIGLFLLPPKYNTFCCSVS